jgi:hypothetical protein
LAGLFVGLEREADGSTERGEGRWRGWEKEGLVRGAVGWLLLFSFAKVGVASFGFAKGRV